MVKILYSEHFQDIYDYFRAIVHKREYSQRALNLTKDALRLNAANYSVWHYRRDILQGINSDLNEELKYVEEVILDNPKNYQVWHHRRVIIEWLSDPSSELAFTAKVLSMDAKNYHAWQHRQWVIRTYNLWNSELDFTDFLIEQDIRNNSAWNQRFFVIEHMGLTAESVREELNYTMNRIHLIKNNESSWNYLRGILQRSNESLITYSDVVQFAEGLFSEGVRSPYLLSFLFDVYVERSLKQPDKNNDELDDDGPHENKNKAIELCELLEKRHDTVRNKYWKYMRDNFKLKIEKTANQ